MVLDKEQLLRHILLAAGALVLTLLVGELTQVDLWVESSFFYQREHWLWSKSEPVARFFFYNIPRALIATLVIISIISAIVCHRVSWLKSYCPPLRIVIFSLILIPVLVGALKQTTNVACPSKVDLFGGKLPRVSLFESYPSSLYPLKSQLCFPAGHASGGFALLSLMFLFHRKRSRKKIAIFVLTLGSMMGIYKMAIGDHYLSHTLISLEISWILICCLCLNEYRIRNKHAQ